MFHFVSRALIVLAVFYPLSSISKNDKPPIKILAFYNTSGELSAFDRPASKGSELRVTEVNDSGGILKGRKITLILVDLASDIDSAEEKTRKALEENPDASAAIGYSSSDFALKVAPILIAKGIPVISPAATYPYLREKLGDLMYTMAFGDNDQGFAIADYSRRQLGTRHLVVWSEKGLISSETLTRFFIQRFKEKGGHISYTDYLSPDQNDVSQMVDRLNTLSPPAQALFISVRSSNAGKIIKQLREAGLSLPIISADSFEAESVVKEATIKNANNIYYATHYFRTPDNELAKSFAKAFKAKYGKSPKYSFAALAYDAVGFLIEGIKASGSSDPKLIAAALSQIKKYQGITGDILFDVREGPPVKPVALVIMQAGLSKLQQVWLPNSEGDKLCVFCDDCFSAVTVIPPKKKELS